MTLEFALVAIAMLALVVAACVRDHEVRKALGALTCLLFAIVFVALLLR